MTDFFQEVPLIGQIPDDRLWKTLGELTIRSQYGLNSSSSEGRNYPMLRMNNLQNGRIRYV